MRYRKILFSKCKWKSYASENVWLDWLTSAPPETTYFNLIQFYFKSLRDECEEVEVENGTGTESQLLKLKVF